ncbi:thaumatin-like protein 1b [Herrania umbratica]|uniref:Thaumatin-like protein 1b n=1 Tax=Herrania umbratica TaxID=108875 RepID=A0A6J1ATK0_9ROSI|nr:thaumatin-like protein 1b [Herrania umbratica]
MEAQVIFGISFVVIFFVSGAKPATFTLNNNCPFTVWPGILTSSGPQLSTTGFELASKVPFILDVPATWSGRLWARTQCTNDNGKFQCATGDCASGQVSCGGAGGIPPASLAEFTLAANNGQDFYDISLVDGFNLPLSIAPQGGSRGCTPVSCTANVNAVCPQELQVKGSDGGVVACQSACLAFNQSQYCCTGAFSTPDTCPPTNYSNIFKSQCPQAYSYAYDDKSGLVTCTGGANYLITFCP